MTAMLSSLGTAFMAADSASLLQWWLEATPDAADHDSAVWQAALGEAMERACAAWPTIALPDRTFVHALARALEPGDAPSRLLELELPHLYLATACAVGDEEAIVAFTRMCRPVLAAALSRFPAEGTFREEVADSVLDRLLVGSGEKPPRIASYRGRGDLGRWVRVACVRAAMDRASGRGGREDPSSDDALLDGLQDGADDPETRYLESRYGEHFRAAFEHAVASLTPRERRLLRERYVHRIQIVRLAKLHATSKSSAARWVDAARDRLVEAVHAYLRERLAVGPEELSSVLRLVTSRLHVSVARILETKR
jgi:RNA polymerase sigma-70 factor, ECF subfamily